MCDLLRLASAWDVDRNIVLEDKRLVLMRFSQFESSQVTVDDSTVDRNAKERLIRIAKDHFTSTSKMDDVLARVSIRTSEWVSVFIVDCRHDVTEFNEMYELDGYDDPFALMIFYRGKHIRVDVGTGNNNKINFLLDDSDLIEILQSAYRAAKDNKTVCYPGKKFSHVSVVKH